MAAETKNTTNNDHKNDVGEICVQVFAKITASVSHEIKNVLAIINENGGLLEDLVMMVGPDGGVPPERVQAATESIGRQVQRANVIMKNINRFAHLGDTPVHEESIAEVLALMVALADRQAAMKNIQLTVDCPADLRLTASMHALAALLYLCLRGIVDLAASSSTLQVVASAKDKGIELRYITVITEKQLSSLTESADLQPLFRYLEAVATCQENVLRIVLPGN